MIRVEPTAGAVVGEGYPPPNGYGHAHAPPRGGERLSTLAETIDPDGRAIVLDEDCWEHILHEHGEMALYREEIVATVTSPDHRRGDPRPGRERYYSQDLGPSHWLFVVVDFNETPARVVTAYANRKNPPGWTTQ